MEKRRPASLLLGQPLEINGLARLSRAARHQMRFAKLRNFAKKCSINEINGLEFTDYSCEMDGRFCRSGRAPFV
jgi:hypothetical protein